MNISAKSVDRLALRLRPFAIALAALAGLALTWPAAAAAGRGLRPWMNPALSPDLRAQLVERLMTQDEKLRLIYGYYGAPKAGYTPPKPSLGSAGYVPGVERLGIPALQETDAGVGVAWAHGARPDRMTTALPAGIALAATWNPELAQQGGAMIGEEASRSGFNVMLAGGINLARDPRGGRNFEYGGEDPLLAGLIVGAAVRGIQSQHLVSTIKHFALNDQETGRMTVSSNISDAAARESDLLAFEIAIQKAQPGAVMCAYNRVNGVYACENDELLNRVLKGDWRFRGWVMSDWGATHSTVKSAMAGLDQESAAEVFDKQLFFGEPFRRALASGALPPARLDDMVHRILRSLFANGVVDHPSTPGPLDYERDGAVSRAIAEQAIVLLKNQGGLLPLAASVRRIAVIGGHADVGVISGGGSSQVMSPGGNPVPGLGPNDFPGPIVFHPSSPLAALRRERPQAEFAYADGRDLKAAAALAARSDVAVVFATQWMGEAFDAPDLTLPDGQDALIAAVAAANPRTIVVLETGGPVLMPWLGQVPAVAAAWYPGSRGGEAIARVLSGRVNPSARLPVTFPVAESQLPRTAVEAPGRPDQLFGVSYAEGSAVGYKWFDRQGLEPLFPFGFGLSYTRFGYSELRALPARDGAVVSFRVTNTGAVRGSDVPQIYLVLSRGPVKKRLIGFSKVDLAPGESRQVTVRIDPKLLASFDERAHGWLIAGGRYGLYLGASSQDIRVRTALVLRERRFGP